MPHHAERTGLGIGFTLAPMTVVCWGSLSKLWIQTNILEGGFFRITKSKSRVVFEGQEMPIESQLLGHKHKRPCL